MQARQLAAAAAFLLGSALLPAVASQKSDQDFLKQAIEINYAEIQMGKLAQEKGQSDEVKSYGKKLAQDHEQANTKAIALAGQLGIQPPTGPSKKQQKEYQSLQKESGDKFDKSFVKREEKDHKNAISRYEKHAKGNTQVAQYAQETLPTLKEHEQTAKTLRSGGGATNSGASSSSGATSGGGAGAEQGVATP